jgi:Bacterial SH3 domain
MRCIRLAASALLLAFALSGSAFAQGPSQAAPAGPYKPVPVKVAPLVTDPSLATFRNQLAAVAQRKDRAALARMVVAKGFFWERDDGQSADAKKSSIDNLVAAFNLEDNDSPGWDALAMVASDPHAAPDPQKKGVACAPVGPELDGKAFEALAQQTKTDPNEWGFPFAAGVEVRAEPKADAPVIEKLGLALVRVTIDESPLHAVEGTSSEWVRVFTPSGKVGYVAAGTIGALVSDQICYLKDASGWKIAGVVGGDDRP